MLVFPDERVVGEIIGDLSCSPFHVHVGYHRVLHSDCLTHLLKAEQVPDVLCQNLELSGVAAWLVYVPDLELIKTKTVLNLFNPLLSDIGFYDLSASVVVCKFAAEKVQC